MELAPLFKIGLPILLILTVGLLGRTRRIGFGGALLLSIVLTPIGGFIIALISGPKPIVMDPPAGKPATQPPVPPKKKSWFSRAA